MSLFLKKKIIYSIITLVVILLFMDIMVPKVINILVTSKLVINIMDMVNLIMLLLELASLEQLVII